MKKISMSEFKHLISCDANRRSDTDTLMLDFGGSKLDQLQVTDEKGKVLTSAQKESLYSNGIKTIRAKIMDSKNRKNPNLSLKTGRVLKKFF